MGIWEGAHFWKGGWLPPSCDFLVLELLIFKLTLSFGLAAPFVNVSKHPYKKASNSLNIFKSYFWKLLFKSKASHIPRNWMESLPFLHRLEILG